VPSGSRRVGRRRRDGGVDVDRTDAERARAAIADDDRMAEALEQLQGLLVVSGLRLDERLRETGGGVRNDTGNGTETVARRALEAGTYFSIIRR
jgi:hypothetical protein